jgi:hypothetical protein
VVYQEDLEVVVALGGLGPVISFDMAGCMHHCPSMMACFLHMFFSSTLN